MIGTHLLALLVLGAAEEVIITVSHATGKVTRGEVHCPDGEPIRVPAGAPVVVKITDTASTLYAHEVSSEPAALQDLAALQAVGGEARPYLAEALRSADRGTRASGVPGRVPSPNVTQAKDPARDEAEKIVDRLEVLAGPLRSRLQTIDGLASPAGRLPGFRNRAVLALRDMAARCSGSEGGCGLTGDGAALCTLLGDSLVSGQVPFEWRRSPGTSECKGDWGLREVADLAVALGKLEEETDWKRIGDTLAELERARAGPEAGKPEVEAVLNEGKRLRDQVFDGALRARADAGALLARAAETEQLVMAVLHAGDSWTAPASIRVPWNEGRKVTVKVAPRSLVGQPAGLPARAVVLHLVPDWPVRPAVGLSLVWAPQAAYDVYGEGKGVAGKVPILRKDVQDSRAQWGLTLSLTPRCLDWREEHDVAIWLAEVTLNPSSDVRSVGLGAGVSWRFLKLGAGALWTRHAALDGQLPGQEIEEGTLKTRSGYGSSFYLSLGIVGWQPSPP